MDLLAMHVPAEGMAAIAGCVFVFALVAGVWISTAKFNRRVRANFARLAAKFGLGVDLALRSGISARPVAEGPWRGRRTQVISTLRRSISRRPVTLVVVEHRGKPIDVSIARPFLGYRDPKEAYVATGDPGFDREFLVKGPPAILKGVLTPALRSKLLRAIELGMFAGTIRGAGQELQFAVYLLLDSEPRRLLTEHMIESLHDLAEGIEGAP